MPSSIEKIVGQPRTVLGSTACRRLRRQGLVPCNVYGHKEGAVAITIESELVNALVYGGSKVIDLEVDGKLDTALVKSIQWNTFSTNVIHIDFVRVDANEKVHVQVPVVLRGTAPGVVAGGGLEQPHHTIEIECLAVEVPDEIQVRVGALQIGQYIHVSDLKDLPKGVTVISPPETVLAHIVDLKAIGAALDAEDAAAESGVAASGGGESNSDG